MSEQTGNLAAPVTQSTENGLPDPAELIERLFPRKRARLVVEVDLDPVPGWGNEAEDWRAMLTRYLNDAAPHYHPTVGVASPGLCKECCAFSDPEVRDWLTRAISPGVDQ